MPLPGRQGWNTLTSIDISARLTARLAPGSRDLFSHATARRPFLATSDVNGVM
jgi:hypothetical protein